MPRWLCNNTLPHPGHTWGGGAYDCPGRAGVIAPPPAARPRPPAPPPPSPAAQAVARAVPVVDLNGLVGDLRAIAATRRHDAETFLEAARNLGDSYEREAGYLEDLAAILEGSRG